MIHPKSAEGRLSIAEMVELYDGILTDVVKLGMKSYEATFEENSMAQFCKKALENMKDVVSKVVWVEGF